MAMAATHFSSVCTSFLSELPLLNSKPPKSDRCQTLRPASPLADCTVQHLSKATSDKLLNKFADMGSGQEELGKGGGGGKRKRRNVVVRRESFEGRTGVERRSLLPVSNRRKGRRLEVIRMTEIIVNSLLLVKVEKTWRGTLDRASKMFLERHFNRHVRLINDAD